MHRDFTEEEKEELEIAIEMMLFEQIEELVRIANTEGSYCQFTREKKPYGYGG